MQAAAPSSADDGRAGSSALLRAIRRTRAAAPAAVPPTPVRTPERAIAAAVSRAADRVHALPLFFDRIATGHVMVAELAEVLPDRPLILLVQGPGDALGVVAVCPGLLASLIEMQALGRITARPAPDRRPTRTDAVVCNDFVDACLLELAAELAGVAGFGGVAGFRVASFLDDPRPLALLLDDIPYRRVEVHLRAGPAGQRDGVMFLALPLVHAAPEGAAPVVPALVAHDAGAAEKPGRVAAGILADTVRGAPLTLQAVLCRRSITLGELRALAPGDRIALPLNALDMAVLETPAGQPLLRGRLGEMAGRHALRLSAPAGRAATGAMAADFAATPGDALPAAGLAATNAALAMSVAGTPDAHGAPAPLRATAAEPPMDDMTAADPFRAMLPTDLSAWDDPPGLAVPGGP
ncbi:FliM/FliN family flagellar motor switch protein [Paracoccus luteus]|uniref:FliM/FliN family flagellar motor switch protein n=1 Tax=Paracoccus luteus TaxID=2508543 RepID=UPI00106F81C8|nr:FliM/FliN family flagellar motor C-terminal domain-containing protein [Paracoccus luteus]